MEKKLKKLSKKVNIFLNRYLSKFNSSELVAPMKYGLFPGGKKIRSKIIFDVGKIFRVKNHNCIKYTIRYWALIKHSFYITKLVA